MKINIIRGLILENDVLYLPQPYIKAVTEEKTHFEIAYFNDDLHAKDVWVHKYSLNNTEIKQFRKWCNAKEKYIKSEQGNLD